MKSFEITNTLADVVLCCTTVAQADLPRTSAQCRPSDFLHALFQAISPFLKEEKVLDGMLRQKVGQALSGSPRRIISKYFFGVAQEDKDEGG